MRNFTGMEVFLQKEFKKCQFPALELRAEKLRTLSDEENQ